MGAAHEANLTTEARRRGAHYTPPEIALRIARLALDAFESGRFPRRVIDPACGGGAFLIAVGDILVQRGMAPRDAMARLGGIDVERGAVDATRAALARWGDGYGTTVADDAISCGDALRQGWGGADLVIGNPPFQSQLATATARDHSTAAALRDRFGAAAGGYVDSALIFLLAASAEVEPGGVIAMIQPWSALASSHGAAARLAIDRQAAMVAAWVPDGQVFDAAVEVWAPVLVSDAPCGELLLEVGEGRRSLSRPTGGSWNAIAAVVAGVPEVTVEAAARVGDIADAVTGFRDEYYAVVAALHESEDAAVGERPVVTSGLVDPLSLRWGETPARIARRRWDRPAIGADSLAGAAVHVERWARRQFAPKVLVATQTRVIEAVADPVGHLLGLTPLVALVPHAPDHAELLAVALSAPSMSALVAWRRAGSGQSRDAVRISAGDLDSLPLPGRLDVFGPALDAHRRGGDWNTVGTLADRALGVDRPEIVEWWTSRLPTRGTEGANRG